MKDGCGIIAEKTGRDASLRAAIPTAIPLLYEAIVANQSHRGESLQRVEFLATMQKAIETRAKQSSYTMPI